MESVLSIIRRTFRPVRVGSFYSLFLSIAVIFATIFYIQMISHLNLPVEASFDDREGFIEIENALVSLYTTRGVLSNTSLNKMRGVKNDTNITKNAVNIQMGALYLRNSSQYVQEILRSLSYNKTLQNLTLGTLTRNDSNKFLNDDSHFEIMLRVKGSGSRNITNKSGNTTVVKLPFNITEDASLNASKVISIESDLHEATKFGSPLLPVSINISRLHSGNNTYLDMKQLYRNITRFRKPNLRPRNSRRPNYCPLWPEELVGPMQVEQRFNRTEIPKANRRWIKEGGRFKPPDCDPRERTAIIIPYRDREKNLMVLLRHLHTVLQRQKIEYGIYVIEMAYPTQFNRGLLANVGFLTASSIAPYTCYIIHDVDLLMQDDRNMYRCGRVPRHLTASNTKYHNKLPYLAYFGGVEAFTPEQFWKVNGFSNLYFGWGGEDDDMVYRIFFTKQHFSRPHQQIGGYVAIEHEKDLANPKNPNRVALVRSAGQRMVVDGVQSVIYNRLALEFKPYYTWAYIAVKEAKIMEKYQEYLDDG